MPLGAFCGRGDAQGSPDIAQPHCGLPLLSIHSAFLTAESFLPPWQLWEGFGHIPGQLWGRFPV